jgi:hypothetical protein
MKYIITESQLKLLHEMSDDIPMFIKRRLSAINDALEHATSPDSVVQPEDYDDDYDYVDDVFNAVMDELSWEVFNDGLTEEQELELRDYLMEYHSDEIMDHYRMYVDDEDDEDDEDLFESEDEMISEKTNIDKSKPVDFYFGNRIFRAPDYETAHRFVEKLAIRNFNSNQVFVYKDKNNEKWFIGANDKIYLNQNLYNQDPNKNVYVDPVKMGLSAL